MTAPLREQLAEIERLRESRVILYHIQGQKQAPKPMDDEDVLPVYHLLRLFGNISRLDLALYASGGSIVVAHKLAHLLRAYAHEVNVLVPYKARSSATLLCLAANQIVMGPLAELSPLDPHLGSANEGNAGSPLMISAEDVRAFRAMSEEWFGVTREEDAIQMLALVAQRIFPTSLSAFYRADQQMRHIAGELLKYQLSDTDEHQRQRIVDRLVAGYHGHDYTISSSEAASLGLRARPTSPEEDNALWSLWQACSETLRSQDTMQTGQQDSVTTGIIASTDLQFHYIVRRVTRPQAVTAPGTNNSPSHQLPLAQDGAWQRVSEPI